MNRETVRLARSERLEGDFDGVKWSNFITWKKIYNNK